MSKGNENLGIISLLERRPHLHFNGQSYFLFCLPAVTFHVENVLEVKWAHMSVG